MKPISSPRRSVLFRSRSLSLGIALSALLVMAWWSPAAAQLTVTAEVPAGIPVVLEVGELIEIDAAVSTRAGCPHGENSCRITLLVSAQGTSGVSALIKNGAAFQSTVSLSLDVSSNTSDAVIKVRLQAPFVTRGSVTLTVSDANQGGAGASTRFDVAAIRPICSGTTVSPLLGGSASGAMAVTLPPDPDLGVQFLASPQSGLTSITPAAPAASVTSIGFTAAAGQVGTRTEFLLARVAGTPNNDFQCPVTITTRAPFDVSLGSGIVHIRRGTYVAIPLAITRAPDFTGPITTSQWIFPAPPGVSSSFSPHSTTSILVHVAPTAPLASFTVQGQGSTPVGTTFFVDQAARRFEIVP